VFSSPALTVGSLEGMVIEDVRQIQVTRAELAAAET
jgi:hypothetical protein